MINNNIGIDLGSESIRIYLQKENKIITTKSIVAIDIYMNKIIAYGKEADLISEKSPKNIVLKRPIIKGKIEDIELTVELIKLILKDNKTKRRITNPNILISYEKSLTNVEREALIDVIRELGAKNIYLMESLKLIALGIGMNIEKAEGKMIIDIGHEITKIGILAFNDIIEYKVAEIGSNNFNNNIIDFLKTKYKILVGNSMSEEIKKELNNGDILIKGKNIITSLPNEITINSGEIKKLIEKSVDYLVNEIKTVLEVATPEIINDIKETGIVITGGGSTLYGLREKLEEKLSIPVLEINNSLSCVIDGIKRVLDKDIFLATKL